MSVRPGVQSSFAGGEISKRLRGQVESELFRKSVARAENWLPMPQGSIAVRGGTRYVVPALSQELTRKFFPFPLRGADGYSVYMTSDYTMRLLDSNGAAVDVDDVNIILNGGFEAGAFTRWTTEGDCTIDSASAARIGTYCAKIISHGVNTDRFWQSMWLPAGTYTIAFTLVFGGTSYPDNHLYVGTTLHGTDLRSYTIPNQPNGTELTTTFTVPGAAGTVAQVWVEFDCDLTAPGGQVLLVDGIHGYATAGTYLYHPFDVTDLVCVPVPDEDAVVFFSGAGEPWKLKKQTASHYSPGPFTWEPIDFTSKPAEWTGTNWPRVVEFYGGRMYAAATPNEPTTIWGSKVGAYNDFTTGSTAADAFYRALITKGVIRWIKGKFDVLLVGTEVGEIACTAQDGVLWEGDFQAQGQSNFGSANIPAVEAGTQVLYVSYDRRKVRVLDYDDNKKQWGSRDVTFTGEHLTDDTQSGSRIRALAFLRDPDPCIVVLLDNGTLALCVYDPALGVAAWSTMGLDADEVDTLAVVHGGTGSRMWLEVDWSASKSTLETFRLDDLAFGADSRQSFTTAADFAAPYGITASSLSSIAQYAAGDYIKVFVGAAYLASIQLIAVGGVNTITLPTPAAAADYQSKVITIGRAYPGSDLVTLSPARYPGAVALLPWVGLRLNNSAFPLVNGERAQPLEGAQDDAVPFTGDAKAGVEADSRSGAVTITQGVPVRTEILALFGPVSENGV